MATPSTETQSTPIVDDELESASLMVGNHLATLGDLVAKNLTSILSNDSTISSSTTTTTTQANYFTLSDLNTTASTLSPQLNSTVLAHQVELHGQQNLSIEANSTINNLMNSNSNINNTIGHNEDDRAATTTKLIASLVLFSITLLCGYLPVRLILSQRYIKHAMFAGGGVLMATAFCHLIPEAHDGYKEFLLRQASGAPPPASPNETAHQHHSHSHEDHPDSQMPLVEITICLGFFFMYALELIMVRFINNHTHEHPCDNSGSISNGRIVIIDGGNLDVVGAIGATTVLDGHSIDATGEHHQGRSKGQEANSEFIGNSSNSNSNNNNNNSGSIGPNSTAGSTSVGNLSAAPIIPLNSNAKQKSKFRSNSFDLNGSAGSTESNNMGTGMRTGFYKFLRGLLIISAFGAHSIFDGVAIGSQETVEGVWTIFFAISCHKLIIAAVVGLELFTATLESHWWTVFHLVLFSIMSPIGIILVVVAQNSLNINSNDGTMILLQAFATGTLLYIIFIEILQPKKGEQRSFSTSFSLLAGFVLMLAVLTFIGD